MPAPEPISSPQPIAPPEPIAVPERFPSRVNVELTNHCNQRCVLCPRQAFTRPLGFMEADVFERVVAECARHETRLWLHFLGEPLLHRGLVRMIGLAKAAGVREVGLSTNAVTLRGALADALLDSGLDRLECSLDADDPEAYRRMRGRDHFERVAGNVRAFLARKRAAGRDRPVTSIQFMRTPEVEDALAPLVEAWRPHLGAHDFIMTIAPAGFAGAIGVEAAPRESPRVPCRWLFSSLMVLQDGTVTMCGADWDAHAPLGHVHDQSLAAIWHGAEMARRRRAHLEGRFDAVAVCGGCDDWRLADASGYVNAVTELDARRRAALPR
jgi:MoaA/NifB/PqqE/SkfB family radical SAM enzyme